jgi:hypothetical protein
MFGTIVFSFFAFLYPFHLHYQEQYQLFLFSGDYFIQYFSKPGGLSDYLGIFITQFFFYSWVGAFIIALLLVLFQRLILAIIERTGGNAGYFMISVIPAIMYWGLLCDENYLVGGLVAVLFVAVFNYLYTFNESASIKFLFLILGIPVLYWISGGAFIVYLLFAFIREFSEQKLSRYWMSLFLLTGTVLSFFVPVFVKNTFLQYPMIRSFVGVNYYRYPISFPLIVSVISILLVLIPFTLHWLTKKQWKVNVKSIIAQTLIVLIFGGWFMGKSVNFGKEEVMEYDFYVRMRKWDDILKKAEKETPTSPLSVICLNLALGKQGLLGEKMFSFLQNGVDGLIPIFEKDYTTPVIAGEVYYHLGFINTAQRFTFEAMEALPDYQKSVRTVKRLAETNLIKGNYALSKKYLKILRKTLYYKRWAKQFEKALTSDEIIIHHPEYGILRNFSLEEDFLFSEGEKDMMLGILYAHNRRNRLAFEYLMAYCLLKKDLQHFVQYSAIGEPLMHLRIPKNFQEALAYAWDVSKSNVLRKIPYNIDPQIENSLKKYKWIYTSNPNPRPVLKENFSDTYWYYFHFRN